MTSLAAFASSASSSFSASFRTASFARTCFNFLSWFALRVLDTLQNAWVFQTSPPVEFGPFFPARTPR